MGHPKDPEVGPSMQRGDRQRRCLARRDTPPGAAAWTSGRWQVSWLAGRHSRRPSRFPSGVEWRGFAAYSCGGSRRFEALPLLRSLLIPSPGTISAQA